MPRITFRRAGQVGGAVGLLGCVWAVVIFAAVLLCVGGIFAIVFGMLRSSEPFKQAVIEVQTNPRAVLALGEPVKVGWFIGGSISTGDDSGEANFEIPVSGAHDKGTLYVRAYKSGGEWRFTQLELVTKTYVNRINLLEE